MGENGRVLIFFYNCKFCQFGGVTSLCPPSPRLSPHLNPFQPVHDKEHKERNDDGTIGKRTNDLVEGLRSRTRKNDIKKPALRTLCFFLVSTLRVLARDNY